MNIFHDDETVLSVEVTNGSGHKYYYCITTKMRSRYKLFCCNFLKLKFDINSLIGLKPKDASSLLADEFKKQNGHEWFLD